MELFTYLMAKNDHNTSVNKDLFSYLLGKNQSGTYTDYSGTSLSINNTKKGKMKVNLLGNTSQTGTPTPETPIDVHIVSGDNTIKVEGKNLFDGTGWRLVQSGNGFPIPSTGATIISSDENNISFTSSQWVYAGVESGFIKVKANETYTLSFESTSKPNRMFVTQYDNSKTRISTLNYSSVSTIDTTTFTTTNDGYIAISFTNTTTSATTYVVNNIQIEKSSTATTYEPYQSTSYPISLGSLELCKISTYKDSFFKAVTGNSIYDNLDSATKETLDYGEWYLEKKIGKVVLDGTTNPLYGDGGSATDYWEYSRTGMTGGIGSQASVLTNYFNQTTNSRIVILSNGGLYFRFPKASGIDVSTNTLLNTWLSNNNTTVYYVLATPTTTEITDTTLVNQLEAVWRANSYKGQTNISQVNDDLPFNLDVEVKVGS